MALLAELAERDATGEKAAIYAEIRQPRRPRPALAALGIDAAALDEIRVVLAAYDRANPKTLPCSACFDW